MKKLTYDQLLFKKQILEEYIKNSYVDINNAIDILDRVNDQILAYKSEGKNEKV